MSDDFVELNGLDIKSYISSQRNCRTAATGYVMEPLNSNLVIDLNSFSGDIKATLILSRISGNGKVKINNIYTDVLSKTFHQIDLDIINNKKIEISRDANSVGKIIINSVKIINITGVNNINLNTDFITKPTLKEDISNWRRLLIKSGNVRGIKLVNDKLYASEGAQIQHANIIESLETDPPQSFVISNVIKFVFPCEIKAVHFKSEFEFNISSSQNKFHHFNKPSAIQSNSIISTNNIINNTNINNMTSSKNNIIYDSTISGLEPNHLINSHDIVAGQGKNGNGLVLKREAGFSIPMSVLTPSMQYVIVANLKKISGNGKFGVAIETTNGEPRSSTIIIAPDRETELYIKLNTEAQPEIGNSYVLKIFRPEDSTVGDLLLERLMVIRGITLASNYINNSNTSQVKNINNNKISKTPDTDDIRATSKQYSRRISHTQTVQQFNYSGDVCIKNSSASNWINKIKPHCPNINIKNNANILLGELGSLNAADRIWVDPFNNDFIPENDDIFLRKAKVLITPSLQNFELFQKLYPDAKVHLLERAWPSIIPDELKYPTGDYAVMIHRTKEITDRIIESYDPEKNPPLVIIGALESYPGFVIPMNEYVAYDKMLGILLNSKLLIDIPATDDYMSGLLSLAFDSGLPALTSNWFGLGKNNCQFIISKDKIGKLNIPKIKDIKIGIEDGLKFNKAKLNIDHNAKVNKILSALFSNEAI